MNKLTFDEYAKKSASTTAEFEHAEKPWYVALGLCGESGEVSDALKKIYRKYGSIEKAPDRTNHILKELGDVLWYLNRMATVLGSSLEEVARLNVEKLQKRKQAGNIIGAVKRDKADI